MARRRILWNYRDAANPLRTGAAVVPMAVRALGLGQRIHHDAACSIDPYCKPAAEITELDIRILARDAKYLLPLYGADQIALIIRAYLSDKERYDAEGGRPRYYQRHN